MYKDTYAYNICTYICIYLPCMHSMKRCPCTMINYHCNLISAWWVVIFSNATSSCHVEINIFITWSKNIMTSKIQKSSLRNMADEASTGSLHWWHYFCWQNQMAKEERDTILGFTNVMEKQDSYLVQILQMHSIWKSYF